jgi:hypothetical protein
MLIRKSVLFQISVPFSLHCHYIPTLCAFQHISADFLKKFVNLCLFEKVHNTKHLKEEAEMECPKCGTVLEDDSKFCVACGAHLESTEDMSSANPNPVVSQNIEDQPSTVLSNAKVSEQNKKRNANLIGLIVGTLIIIVGFTRIMSAGTSISSTSFGGDFYTYTYQGIVAISEILASIEVSLGWVIVAIGAAIDICSLQK